MIKSFINFSLLIPLVIYFTSCSKEESSVDTPNSQMITKAQSWYETTPHKTGALNWDKATIVINAQSNTYRITVPYPFTSNFEKGSRGIRRVIFSISKGIIKGEVIEIVGTEAYIKTHKTYNPADFTGLIGRSDLNQQFKKGDYYNNGSIKYNAVIAKFPSQKAFESRIRPELQCDYYTETRIDPDGVFTVYGYSVCTDEGSGGTNNPGTGGGNPDPGDGGGGNGGSGDGPVVDDHWDPEKPRDKPTHIEAIKSELNNPCLTEAYKSVLSKDLKNRIATTMDKMFGGKSNFDLIFREKPDNEMPGAMGRYNVYDSHLAGKPDGTLIGGVVYIDLNVDALPKASKEFIVTTMLHESLHGFLKIQGVKFDEPYINQHEKMASVYTSSISDALMEIFPTISKKDQSDLSWTGLLQTLEWTSKQLKDASNKTDATAQIYKNIYNHQLGTVGTSSQCK
ncbi:hypothetical protein [Chitinophaga nivalis]|uniref:SprT-like domain-containing protein n=1 Tax=Chitinophaga nivalis TaxID=2991709 RepID=A0ABT3IM36_9BACT|nr:hypothetical protein [Chitinophaga nivalis]MCW3465283.1 hypothetical protein [Chitinophaga nivalis]MCW3485025.1 hypothetical protein [Chitinophaga nivalis]